MEDLKINGVVIDGELVTDFFELLTRRISQYKIGVFLRSFIDGRIDPMNILNGIVSERELEQMKRELNSLKQANGSLSRSLDNEKRKTNEAFTAKRKAEKEAHEYFEAVRYYEDYLVGISMRKEILDRSKYSEIFSEEEEGWTT
jgi:hypothetical protein